MATQSPSMKCEHLDYLEMACMFAYRVELTLMSQSNSASERLVGVAQTIEYKKDVGEVLRVKADEGRLYSIPLQKIKAMKVLTKNARIGDVVFS